MTEIAIDGVELRAGRLIYVTVHWTGSPTLRRYITVEKFVWVYTWTRIGPSGRTTRRKLGVVDAARLVERLNELPEGTQVDHRQVAAWGLFEECPE